MVRVKNRYIVARIAPQTSSDILYMTDAKLVKCLLENLHKNFGDADLGKVEQSFRVKYCNEQTKIAIIRCPRKERRRVATTLPLISMIGDVPAKFVTIYTGATIMQCNKFIIKYHQDVLPRMVGTTPSVKERHDLIKRIMEIE